jgi:hypothetical protein
MTTEETSRFKVRVQRTRIIEIANLEFTDFDDFVHSCEWFLDEDGNLCADPDIIVDIVAERAASVAYDLSTNGNEDFKMWLVNFSGGSFPDSGNETVWWDQEPHENMHTYASCTYEVLDIDEETVMTA